MLAYTIGRLLTQLVVFERDQAVPDQFGGEAPADWRPLSTVPCRAWWERQSSRGPSREEATGQESLDVGQGGMLIRGDTDITGLDRIGQITDRHGNVLFAGPLHITAILPHASYPALIEIAFKDPD